ncbi:MAG TPA: hypothetical protein VH796_06150 [Nitrososphaeraceae archaeon]
MRAEEISHSTVTNYFKPAKEVTKEMLSMLAAVPIYILLKVLLENARKRFRFYYAKACFDLINKIESETDKEGFLSGGLEWYNKVVNRTTKL